MSKKTFKDELENINIQKDLTITSPLSIENDGVANLQNAKLISIELIFENPDQPRKKFNETKLKELAESIKERGILQPIRVRPYDDGYQIIAGERRWRASQLAGLKELPAIVCDKSDEEAHTDALVENIQREGLNAMDRADALVKLKVNLGSPSWEEVGQKVGISKRHVLNLIGLRALPENIQEEIRNDIITEKHGRALKTLLNKPLLFQNLHEEIKERKLSGDQTLVLARSLKSKDKDKRFKKEFSAITKHRDEIISILSIMNFESISQDDKRKILETIFELKKQADFFLGEDGF